MKLVTAREAIVSGHKKILKDFKRGGPAQAWDGLTYEDILSAVQRLDPNTSTVQDYSAIHRHLGDYVQSVCLECHSIGGDILDFDDGRDDYESKGWSLCVSCAQKAFELLKPE